MPIMRSILAAAAFAAAVGAGMAHAEDTRNRSDDRPDARYCTNDPNLADTLYEYLQDCPAASAVMNRAGAWTAVERGSVGRPDVPPGGVDTPPAPPPVDRGGATHPGPGGGMSTPPEGGDMRSGD